MKRHRTAPTMGIVTRNEEARPVQQRQSPVSGTDIAPTVERATYTVEEAAKILGISRSTAYECARTGELPVLRFGRRMVVPATALRLLVD